MKILRRIRNMVRRSNDTTPTDPFSRWRTQGYIILGSIMYGIAQLKLLEGAPPKQRAEKVEELSSLLQSFLKVKCDETDFPACADCSMYGYGYMLEDNLWQKISKTGDRYLCLVCVQERLGRLLVSEDFSCAPINTPIFAAMEVGRREQTS